MWFETYATITKEGKIESNDLDVILKHFVGKRIALKVDDLEDRDERKDEN